ncbi:hypothetical protein ALC60_12622 [Trachymyrmex zeteki]|uniref:Uncharacterized protein n=1 Tax=Mycetomoellerius zeteki TaxID=64791 RepID=A0A151WKC9_9HYME|nr:hypothetical protein ALC60_12622 [Trachymyrmex zeteki]
MPSSHILYIVHSRRKILVPKTTDLKYLRETTRLKSPMEYQAAGYYRPRETKERTILVEIHYGTKMLPRDLTGVAFIYCKATKWISNREDMQTYKCQFINVPRFCYMFEVFTFLYPNNLYIFSKKMPSLFQKTHEYCCEVTNIIHNLNASGNAIYKNAILTHGFTEEKPPLWKTCTTSAFTKLHEYCLIGKKRRIAVRGIEISDSNLNSAFERQPCSAAKQLEVGTVCAVWHKKTVEKWALSPLWKNRFKLAPRVPKPRFKKLVKNCQRFSSKKQFMHVALKITIYDRAFWAFQYSVRPLVSQLDLSGEPKLAFRFKWWLTVPQGVVSMLKPAPSVHTDVTAAGHVCHGSDISECQELRRVGKSANNAPRWFGGRHLKSGDWSPPPRDLASGDSIPDPSTMVIVGRMLRSSLFPNSLALEGDRFGALCLYPLWPPFDKLTP